MNNLVIGNKKIGNSHPVFIIAEAGVNHNGNIKLAKNMIETAKWAGADAIKFQTYKTEELVTKNAPKANYQKKTIPGKSQFEMLKKFELSELEFEKLYNYCKKKQIIFLSTPFDFKSAEFLYKLGVPAFKISSGDLTNTPLLKQIGQYRLPIILSTGMSTLREVREAVNEIYSTGNKKLILLHCTSNYPTQYKDVNLKAMNVLKREFDVPVGYSDHTIGIEVAIAAKAIGACVIEKHFTLNRHLIGPDHSTSIEPNQLRALVRSVRNIEESLGDGTKRIVMPEKEVRKVARKSIVAKRNISKGTRIVREMLAIKRPGFGIKPKHINKLVGRQANDNLQRDEVLTWEKVSL